ncbi:MAG: SpoIIE family protein phosphatase [bacterium]|nr:SpoIIE family protein phosphatase [bacterium]
MPNLEQLNDRLRTLSELAGRLIQSLQAGQADSQLAQTFLALWRETVRAEAVLDLFREVERERQENETLVEISMRLSSSSAIEDVLHNILDSLRRVVNFAAAGIFVYNRDLGQIEIDMLVGYEGSEREKLYKKFQEGVRLGQGIVGTVIQTGQSVYDADVRVDARYIPARAGTMSELAVPILVRGEVIGALNLEADHTDAFSDRDLKSLTAFASHAGVAVERARTDRLRQHSRRIQEEIELARRIQLSFLPRSMPEFPPFDLAGVNLPSSEVGGDYFDFIPITETDMGVVIGDATGHGVGAALLMANFRACLRIESRNNFAIRTILGKVNDYLFETSLPDSYVTAVYGVLDRRNGIFSYANAGHNPPLLFRRDGRVERLDVGGLILGVFSNVSHEETAVALEPGDLILFYTDGVTEALDSRAVEFSVERLIGIVEKNRSRSAREILQGIMHEVRQFQSSEQSQDDLTLSIIKYD